MSLRENLLPFVLTLFTNAVKYAAVEIAAHFHDF